MPSVHISASSSCGCLVFNLHSSVLFLNVNSKHHTMMRKKKGELGIPLLQKAKFYYQSVQRGVFLRIKDSLVHPSPLNSFSSLWLVPQNVECETQSICSQTLV